MRILITGGAGFVGSSLALLFARAPGSAVTAFDNLHRRGSELALTRLRRAGVSFVHGDIRNPEDFDSLPCSDLLIECSAEPSVHAGYDGGTRYLVAAEGSLSAAPIALSTRQPVITMGGFMGGDPAPTASELRGLVRSGQVRYVLLGGLGNLIAAGGPPGSGGSRRDRAGVQARQRWVTANCRAVNYGSAGRGPPQSLYDCSGASAA